MHGGSVPLMVAIRRFALVTTWTCAGDALLGGAGQRSPLRAHGTAVFTNFESADSPGVLLQHLAHQKKRHDAVIPRSVVADGVPEIPRAVRVRSEAIRQGLFRAMGLGREQLIQGAARGSRVSTR